MEATSLIDISKIASLATQGLQVKEHNGFQPVVVVPPNYELKTLTPDYAIPLPDRIMQRVNINELDSFIAYVKSFATSTARIFASTGDKGANFNAILDYHEAGKDGKPSRCNHRVEFNPAYSPEFGAWLAINKQPQTQEAFLDFLRRWGQVVTSHSDADLIELASSLEFTQEGQFSSKMERTKGGRQLIWNQQVEGTGHVKGTPIPVPESLTIKTPIFVGGREYSVKVDLLYRVQNGTLKIHVELSREALVIREAVKDLVNDVYEGTGIQPFIGSPA